jgi:hypothetical protein
MMDVIPSQKPWLRCNIRSKTTSAAPTTVILKACRIITESSVQLERTASIQWPRTGAAGDGSLTSGTAEPPRRSTPLHNAFTASQAISTFCRASASEAARCASNSQALLPVSPKPLACSAVRRVSSGPRGEQIATSPSGFRCRLAAIAPSASLSQLVNAPSNSASFLAIPVAGGTSIPSASSVVRIVAASSMSAVSSRTVRLRARTVREGARAAVPASAVRASSICDRIRLCHSNAALRASSRSALPRSVGAIPAVNSASDS